jgi:CheY-like chemotaxis protein
MKKSYLLKSEESARVLLVDDNLDGLSARKSVLEDQCFAITSAANGEDGFKALSQAEFDLMVTDFKMPKMDGLELIRRAKESYPGLRVILLSGFVDGLGFDERSTGADVVITKGRNEISYLLRALTRLLARKVAKRPPASQKDLPPSSRAKSV